MNARTRRGFALMGSAAALGAVSTASAAQTSYNLSAAKTSEECGTVATASVFSRWGDTALYAPAIGGNMEPDSQASWFRLGASFIAGNESFYLGGRSHKYSLRLPPSSLANAPWLCVGADFPTARFVVRNTGALSGRLAIDVQYYDAVRGVVGNVHLADVAATSKWAPSPAIPLSLPAGATRYRINFSNTGAGDFQMDDLYIDPMRRSV